MRMENTLPGDSRSGNGPNLDVFSKSEKWLAPAPVPPVSDWKNRESEILGWSDYLSQVIAWAAQASEIFASEIGQASRWATKIEWDTLSKAQKSRSSRLFAILKAAFSGHPRTNMLIAVFSEGLSLHSFGGSSMSIGEANANGYELVRQLTLEFSLRSRSEALNVRASLASKSFVLSNSETTPGSIVSDTIRKMDFECSRYSKLIATLPTHVDGTGLALPEAGYAVDVVEKPPNLRKLNEVYDSSQDDWWWSDQDWSSYSYDGYVDQCMDGMTLVGMVTVGIGVVIVRGFSNKKRLKFRVSGLRRIVKHNQRKKRKERPVGSLVLSPIFYEGACDFRILQHLI